MITFQIAETKSHLILILEDDLQMTRQEIRLLYREAAGLKHVLDQALANPAFKHRDPKSVKEEIHVRSDDLRSV